MNRAERRAREKEKKKEQGRKPLKITRDIKRKQEKESESRTKGFLEGRAAKNQKTIVAEYNSPKTLSFPVKAEWVKTKRTFNEETETFFGFCYF